MQGKLFGIGVGPGDPELLTIKAVKVIQECDVIAGQKTAFSIINQYLDKKETLECRFCMENDMDRREEARHFVAGQIMGLLRQGKNVGFVTLGDACTYSSYMYIHDMIVRDGFAAEIVPGITSFAAAAAAFGTSLCEDDEALTIIPAKNNANLDDLLDIPGNKVLMKGGEGFSATLEKLRERGYEPMVACRVTMGGEQLMERMEEYEKLSRTEYLTVAIAKKL